MSRRSPLLVLACALAASLPAAPAATAARAPHHAARQTGWTVTAARDAGGRLHRRARTLRRTAAEARRAPRRAPRRALPPAPAAAGGLEIGLVANSQGMGTPWAIGREQDRVAATGARWIREEVRWSLVEPRPGSFDFSHYDDVFAEAARRGLRVLPTLDDTPSWAGAEWNTVPRDPAAYAEYVRRVVARYGPSGAFWQAHPAWAPLAPQWFELWNEPYVAPGGADEYDPPRYARLVRAAAQAGRAADPAARFLLAADVTGRARGDRWVPWVDALYEAMPDLNRWFDGVAVHPYGKDLTGLDGPGFRQFRRIEVLRRAFADHGGADKPFWATEIGWSTCTGDPACVTEAEQAEALRGAIAALRTTYGSFVQAVFLYHLRDWGPRDGADQELWFGLDRRDGSHKPAWYALRDVTGAS